MGNAVVAKLQYPRWWRRPLRHRVACALGLAILSACFISNGRAQPITYPIALQQEWQPEFRAFTLDNYRGLMQPHLTAKEAHRLQSVRFEFPVGPHDQHFNFFSSSDDRVAMPVASLLFFKDLAFASAWLSVNGYSTIPVLDYVSILAHGGLVRWPQNKRLPKDALGIPAGAADSPEVMQRYEGILLNIVLFVLAHELGHITHGFEGPNSGDFDRRRQAERDADLFALELFRRMKQPPVPLPLFFGISSRQISVSAFAGSETSWRSWVSQRSHPLDGERIQNAARFLAAHRDDFEQGLRNPATAPAHITNLIAEFMTLASTVDDPSLAVTQADCTLTYQPEDLLPRKGAVLNVLPRPGERFAAGPWSGVYEGTISGARLGQSTAIRLILRRDGERLTGASQYLCFRGAIDGLITDDTAVVRWTLGNIVRTLKMRSATTGASFSATWQSDGGGGNGTVTGKRVSLPTP